MIPATITRAALDLAALSTGELIAREERLADEARQMRWRLAHCPKAGDEAGWIAYTALEGEYAALMNEAMAVREELVRRGW